MASAREMRLRIKSVKNISQVTRALETVSASKVRKAINAVTATRSYATKAWQVLKHVAEQPGRDSLHPLLAKRNSVNNTLVVVITGDRGLAGAYNSNVIRFTAQRFDQNATPVKYIAVGRKGRDLLVRRRKQVIADFSNLPAAPTFMDVSAIGRMAVDEFLRAMWMRSTSSIPTSSIWRASRLRLRNSCRLNWVVKAVWKIMNISPLKALLQRMNMNQTRRKFWMRLFRALQLAGLSGSP
jgi:ATP synthase F1 gamma subunit